MLVSVADQWLDALPPSRREKGTKALVVSSEALARRYAPAMTLITDNEALAAFCGRMHTEQFVAIDTEFMRDRTYYPKLCLVQVAGESEAVAIDPLAVGLDLTPLLGLLADEAVLKVMHAGTAGPRDLLSSRPPAPTILRHPSGGHGVRLRRGGRLRYAGEQAGRGPARQELQVHGLVAPTTVGSTDPLRPGRRHPSAGDLSEAGGAVEQAGRTGWVVEELEALLDPKLYAQPPEEAWRRLKLRSRDARFIAIIQALAAWREREAQRRDLPRARVVRDDLLLEVAANRPQSIEELRALERVNLDRESAAAVVATVRSAMALPRSELPAVPEPVLLPRGIGPTIDLLRVLLKLRSEDRTWLSGCSQARPISRLSRSTTMPTCRHYTAGGGRFSVRTRLASRPAAWLWRCVLASPW